MKTKAQDKNQRELLKREIETGKLQCGGKSVKINLGRERAQAQHLQAQRFEDRAGQLENAKRIRRKGRKTDREKLLRSSRKRYTIAGPIGRSRLQDLQLGQPKRQEKTGEASWKRRKNAKKQKIASRMSTDIKNLSSGSVKHSLSRCIVAEQVESRTGRGRCSRFGRLLSAERKLNWEMEKCEEQRLLSQMDS